MTTRPEGGPDPRRVYLAGPEVFLPDVEDIAERKNEKCRRRGLIGVFPQYSPTTEVPTIDDAHSIFQSCIRDMRSSYIMIANLTPFRGISADVGTAVELGYMHGLGRPTFGYTNVHRSYADRVQSVRRRGLLARLIHRRPAPTQVWGFGDDSIVEPYSAFDNLMCEGPLWSTLRDLPDCHVSEAIVKPAGRRDLSFDDLSLFDVCLDLALRLPKVREALPS
jgi:nucleoside 2-deoxyribosyltransferase